MTAASVADAHLKENRTVNHFGCSRFSVEGGLEGNPKAEIRNLSQSTLLTSARAEIDLGRRATEDGAGPPSGELA